MKKKISNFVYGIQYYRAPTPLPQEWEYDLKEMDKAGIDTIQLRIQWRWNEPSEGKYEFDDIDKLFELSEQYGKKVIIKFMMETAPDYIFNKYKGLRRDMHGLPINYGANGAYYVGGWWPCFENPDVMRKALEFVRVFTDRYKSKENLILWNIWNEPRSRPIGDCGCEHSIKAYRQWLKDGYESIEKLNDFFGKKWESFDTINPPGMPGDYAELFLFRKWMGYAVAKRLEDMYRVVKELDPERPVISHVGASMVTQDAAGDVSDDIQNSSKVDFYGMSLSTVSNFKNILEESTPFMINDWIRSVSEYFWVYELYPDWGSWFKPVSMGDFKLKVFSCLAGGAKGIMYWQYRAERLGFENNLAGLVNMDGSFKEISHESAKIRDFINENEEFLLNASVKHDGIGILYSLDSDLISRIENTGFGINNFDLQGGFPYLYKKALKGIYALFRELGLTTAWIDSRKIKGKLDDIKVLYIPEGFMLSQDMFEALKEFREKGGCVIVEEGISIRQQNTWLYPEWTQKSVAEFFGIKITERVSTIRGIEDSLSIYGHAIPAVDFISYIDCNGSLKIGQWQDGRAGAAKKDNLFYIGTSLGASFHDHYEPRMNSYKDILSEIMGYYGITNTRNLPEGIYIRELYRKDKSMYFVFNRTDVEQEIKIGEGKCVTVQPKDIAVIKK